MYAAKTSTAVVESAEVQERLRFQDANTSNLIDRYDIQLSKVRVTENIYTRLSTYHMIGRQDLQATKVQKCK